MIPSHGLTLCHRRTCSGHLDRRALCHPHRDGRNKSGHDIWHGPEQSAPLRLHAGYEQSEQKETPMTKLELLLEEIVTANRILAREGVVDSFGHVSARHPDNPQRFLLVAGARARLHRGRRHHGVHARRDGRRCGRARALSRALHPRRHLRGAAGRPFGRAQSQPERHSVRGDRQQAQAAAAHVRQYRPRGADLGFARQVRRYRAPGRQRRDGPRSGARHGGGPHRADARPRRHRSAGRRSGRPCSSRSISK